MSRRRQRLVAVTSVVALAAAGLGLSASRAEAVVTGTSITSSSYPGAFAILVGSRDAAAAGAAPLELDGTYSRTGVTADGVDTQCYSGTTTTLVGTQGSPSSGAFKVTGAAPVGSICDLRAVPSGTVPTSTALASYPALRQAFDYAGTTPETAAAAAQPTPTSSPTALSSASPPFATSTAVPSAAPTTASTPESTAPSVNGAVAVHVQAGLPQSAATVTLGDTAATGSSPTGGVSTTLLDGNLVPGPTTVFAGAGLLPTDGATVSKTQTQVGGIRIDGVNVLTPGAAADIWGTDGNQPSFNGSVTVTSAINPQTGDATVTSSEPLLVCPDTSLPATKATCTSFSPIGVTLSRTTRTFQGGRVVQVSDSFSGATAHSITMAYEHTVTSTSTGTRDAGAEFSVDGGGSYLAGAQGTSLTLPAAPFSVLVKTSGDATSAAHPAGSVTYSTTPTSAVFANGGATLVTRYDRSIPAGGTFTLSHSYASSDTDAGVASLSAYAITAGLAPSISFAVPASVSGRNTSIAGVVATGQNGLPTSVTVAPSTSAGTPTGPAVSTTVDPRTGIFAVPMSLHPGVQTVAATVVDAVGTTVTRTTNVSYDNPLTTGRLDDFIVYSSHLVTGKKLVGKKIKSVKVRVRYVSGIRLLVPLHCSSQATTVCTAKIKISSHGKLLKTVIFTRGPGYRPIVTIPLVASAYGSAGYNASHSPKPTKSKPHPKSSLWAVGVTVSYTDPDGSSYPGFTAGSIRI